MATTAPREPYPPDMPGDQAELAVDDGERLELRGGVIRHDLAERSVHLLDLTDVRVEGADWANLRVPRLLATRVELRGADRLAGVQMTWDDVLANAPTFAAALGIELVE